VTKLSELLKLGATTFAAGDVAVQNYRKWVVITNGDTISHTFTFTLKNAGESGLKATFVLQAGETEPYPVAPFESIAIDTATSSVVAFFSDTEISSLDSLQVVTGFGSARSPVNLSGSAPQNATTTILTVANGQVFVLLRFQETANINGVQLAVYLNGAAYHVLATDAGTGITLEEISNATEIVNSIPLTSAFGGVMLLPGDQLAVKVPAGVACPYSFAGYSQPL